MGLSAFFIAQRMNEASKLPGRHVDAHPFFSNDPTACTNEMNYAVMSETADYMHIRTITDEMLLECSVTNKSAFAYLDENVFSTVKDKVKKFFEKIISLVKGIITKLKAMFYKMTDQFGKWVQTMRKPIEDAAKRDGSYKFKYMMNDWDETFVTTTMTQAVKSAFNEWDAKMHENAVPTGAKLTGDVSSFLKARQEEYNNTNLKDTGGKTDEDVKSTVDEAKKLTEKIEDSIKEFEKNFTSTFGAHFGVSTASSEDSLWTGIEKKAHHGKSDKREVQVGNNYKHILEVIESCKDTISDLKNEYDTHLDKLSTFKEKLDSDTGNGDLEIKTDSTTKEYPNTLVAAYREQYKTMYDFYISITNKYETYIGAAKDKNVKFVQDMTKEYMSAMSAFAGYKPDKKD